MNISDFFQDVTVWKCDREKKGNVLEAKHIKQIQACSDPSFFPFTTSLS